MRMCIYVYVDMHYVYVYVYVYTHMPICMPAKYIRARLCGTSPLGIQGSQATLVIGLILNSISLKA